MSGSSEERKRYLDLQSNHCSAKRTIQNRLRAQKNTLAHHLDQQMQALDRQDQALQRKRNAQHTMLMQRYEHQQQQMKQRHKELLIIKEKLHSISDQEHRQVEHEAKLRQRGARVQAIQTDFANREERAKSQRDLLVERKNAIQKEMADLAEMTGQLDQLNLGAEVADQTLEQKQQMDHFVVQNPKPYLFDDYKPLYSRHEQSRQMRNRYSAFDDEESDYKEYSDPLDAQITRRERRDSRDVRQTRQHSGDRRRTARRLSLKMTISPRKMEQERRRSSTRVRSLRKMEMGSETRPRRQSKSGGRRSLRSVRRDSVRSARSRRDSIRSNRSHRDSIRGRNSERRSPRSQMPQQPRTSRYESKSGNLYVRLVNARSVFGNKGSMADTYVRMECDGQMKESPMIRNGDSVRNDECFKFVVRNYEESMLTIRLIDACRDETIAKVRVPTAEFVDMADNGELEIDLDTEMEYADNHRRSSRRSSRRPSSGSSRNSLVKMRTLAKIKNKLGKSGRRKRRQSR